jgi:hypothetical protein
MILPNALGRPWLVECGEQRRCRCGLPLKQHGKGAVIRSRQVPRLNFLCGFVAVLGFSMPTQEIKRHTLAIQRGNITRRMAQHRAIASQGCFRLSHAQTQAGGLCQQRAVTRTAAQGLLQYVCSALRLALGQ